MTSLLRIAFAASLFGATVFCANPGLAHPGMGGSMGGGMGMGSNMGGGFGAHGMGSANGQFGGLSDSHISAQGSANTNGPDALDRDTGFDRAQDRMNAEGKTHNRASAHHTSDNDRADQPVTTKSTSTLASTSTLSSTSGH